MNSRRIRSILFAVLAQFTAPFTRILLSLVVIRMYSGDLWGVYVQYYLAVSLGMIAISWGSRDFLLRAYSRDPQSIGRSLAGSIAGKTAVAAVMGLALVFIPLPFNKVILALWLGGQMSWQFFESLNTYRGLFLPSALTELLLSASMLAVILFVPLGIVEFLALFITAEWIKGLVFGWLNRKFILVKALGLRSGLVFLRSAFPFLVLVITGAAAARGDLYVLALKMDRGHLAQYQVLSNFIQSSHLLASAILLPFIKNLYRLPKDAVLRMERRFLQAGLIMTPFLTGLIYLILSYGYGFGFFWRDYFLAAGLVFGYYAYFIRMQVEYRMGNIYFLVRVLLVMGWCKVTFSLWLIPDYGITGALIAALASYLAGIVGFWLKGKWVEPRENAYF